MTPEDARYVESLRRAAERERGSANHRLLVVAALERKVRRLEARVLRGEALFEAALRMGLQCGTCEACSRGEPCIDPACEMREALARMARPPEMEEERAAAPTGSGLPCRLPHHPRDALGKLARDAFVLASADLDIAHPETPEWYALPERSREMYRRIGDALARAVLGSGT